MGLSQEWEVGSAARFLLPCQHHERCQLWEVRGKRGLTGLAGLYTWLLRPLFSEAEERGENIRGEAKEQGR